MDLLDHQVLEVKEVLLVNVVNLVRLEHQVKREKLALRELMDHRDPKAREVAKAIQVH